MSHPSTSGDPRQPQRLWLVNLFFGPTGAPTGRLLESLALGLLKRGYQPQIITGTVDYSARADSDSAPANLRARRIYCGRSQPKRLWGRLCSWLWFYLGTACFIFTRPLPDRVVMMTTPPLLPLLFVIRNLLARRKAELILWNQDTYPEILAAVGILSERQWSYRLLRAAQRFGISRIDKAIVLDQAMRQRVEAYGAPEVRVIPNWERDNAEAGHIDDPDLRRLLEHVAVNYRYLIVHTGNYGWGHDLTIVHEYLQRFPTNRDFFFLFVGGGEKWSQLQALREQARVECMAVLPYVSKSSLAGLLREAHFGLVALEKSCVGLMSPSKIHTYLLAGTPLIYVGAGGSNVADAIESYGCGFRIGEHDASGLADCLETIRAAELDHADLSRRAAAAGNERYVERVGVAEILDYLDLLPRETPGSEHQVPAGKELLRAES
jgi:hypothetical protein